MQDDEPLPEDDSNGVLSKVRDDIPDRPSTQGSGFGATLGDAVAGFLKIVILGPLLFVTRIVPGTWKFWRGLLRAGYRGVYKTTNADYIGHICVGDKIKHIPVRYDHEEEKIKTLSDDPEWWNIASEGDNTYRTIGNVPAVWAAAEANEVGSHVQAEIAEVLDIPDWDADAVEAFDYDFGEYGRPVVQSATVQHLELDMDSGGQQAVADGGRAPTSVATVRNPGQLADYVADLSHADDARVVSMNKYYETYPSVIDPEEMKRQEDRGRMAEHRRDYAKLALKMMLIAAAIIAIVVLGPPIISALFGGGGGGGGGGILPGLIGLGGWF